MYAVRWESFTDNSLSYRLLVAELLVGALVLIMDYVHPEDPPRQLPRGHSPRVRREPIFIRVSKCPC